MLRIALRQIKWRLTDTIHNFNPSGNIEIQEVLFEHRLDRLKDRGDLSDRLADINFLMRKEKGFDNFRLVNDMLNCDGIWTHFCMYERFVQKLSGWLKHKVILRKVLYNAIEDFWETFLVCHYKKVHTDLSGRRFLCYRERVGL